MARKIETTIALDGEQKFKQALASASREMRVMESEARALSAAYDQNGDAAAFFASRQQNLRNQIQQQEQIVSALERAVKESAEAFGESSSQTDGWAIKLNNARARLSKLQKELESTDREAEELGRDSVKVGRQIENGIGDGAREAEDSVNSLFEAMQRDISSIKTSGAIQAVGTLWDMASGAYSSVKSFVSGTVEYRRQLSFLQQNAETRGFDFSKIKEQLIEVQVLTGESSSAVEGLSNLLQTEMTSDQMERAIENLAGAVISFPDTLKFESLADGLQETLATGEATGQFAELLERMGVEMDTFNAALEESPTAIGDVEIALAYMAQGGLNDVYTKWQQTNQEMSKAEEKRAELEVASAELAGELESILFTPFEELKIIAVEETTEAIRAAREKLDELGREMGWTTDTTGATGAFAPSLWGTKTDYEESPYVIVDGKLYEIGSEPQEGQYTGTKYEEPIGPQTLAQYEADGKEAAAAYMNGLELEIDTSLWGEGKEAEKLFTISPVEMEEAGEEAGEALTDGFASGIEDMESMAESTGAAIGAAFGTGLASQVSYVAAASSALAAAAAAGLRAAGQLGALQRAGSTGVPMVINLDGRQVGSGLAPFASALMAAEVNIQ